MSVGLPEIPDLLPVPGVSLGSTNAGISNRDRDDLALIKCAPSTATTVVFTQNRFCAAPVVLAKQHLNLCAPRVLVVNSGNANAGTGAQGVDAAARVCGFVASGLGVATESVLPFSTGVIGQALPVAKFEQGLPRCIKGMREDGWLAAARAIMTTDTVPKGVSRRFLLGQTEVTLTGIVKGSGMIRPNMATMLGFVATDAGVARPLLDALLQRVVGVTFNRITVDGDTSTNDACALLATGRADMPAIENEDDARFSVLAQNLEDTFSELAQALVRDGEGATKFVTVEVAGAATERDAESLAFAVAHSPLVKTALFASDPNWGRILAVVGRADVTRLDIGRVDILVNDVQIVAAGEPSPTYSEQAGQRAMSAAEIHIVITLGVGNEGVKVWTTDLSYDYVKINAEYRT